MSKDLKYQKILNLNVYALSQDKKKMPHKKQQIFLNQEITDKVRKSQNFKPRGRIESEVSFEEENQKRRTFRESNKNREITGRNIHVAVIRLGRNERHLDISILFYSILKIIMKIYIVS